MKEFLTSLLVGIKEKEISNEDKEILRNLLNLGAVSSHKDKFYLNNGYVCGKLDISQNATGFIMPFDKRFKQDIIVENKNLNNSHLGDIVLAKLLPLKKKRQSAKIVMSLKLANEIHSIIWAVSYTAGMGLAGVYIHFFGIKSAFLLDGALYLCSFGFLYLLKLDELKPEFIEKPLKMLKNGLKYLKENRLIVHLIFLHAFVGITAYDALIALLADYKYANLLSASLIIGLLNASRSLSLMFAPALLSKFINKNTLVYVYIGQGLGIIIWALSLQNFYLALVGIVFAGFCTSSLWSYTYTLLQQNCQKEFYGRVIAYNDMVFLGFSALISFAIGLLFELGLSVEMIAAFMGSLFFIGAFYYHAVSKKYEIK